MFYAIIQILSTSVFFIGANLFVIK